MTFHWHPLHQLEQIDDIIRMSAIKPQVIFKHSSRCSISSVSKRRLEHAGNPENIDFHFLDLISFRDISAKVGQVFDVWHESPQVLLIINGECVYDESHMGIDMEEIIQQSIQK